MGQKKVSREQACFFVLKVDTITSAISVAKECFCFKYFSKCLEWQYICHHVSRL